MKDVNVSRGEVAVEDDGATYLDGILPRTDLREGATLHEDWESDEVFASKISYYQISRVLSKKIES